MSETTLSGSEQPRSYKSMLLINAFTPPAYAGSFSIEDTLIVTPCLVSADLAASAGYYVVNPDTIIAELNHTDAVVKTGDMRLRGCDWFFDGSKDLTVFEGSSLGRKFLITGMHILAMHNYLETVLSILFVRHAIQELHHFGYSTGYPNDADIAAADFIATMSFSHGIACHVHARQADTDHFERGFRHCMVSWAHSIKLSSINQVMRVLGAASRHFSRDGRFKVLVLATHLNASRMLERYKDLPVQLILLSDNFPNRRNIGSVLHKIFYGIRIAFLPFARLTPDEQAQVDAIKSEIRKHYTRDDSLPLTIRDFTLKYFLESGKLEQQAVIIKQARALLLTLKPDIVFTDSLSNGRFCAIMEQAKLLDIPTASTWHAPLLHEIKSYLLGSDPRTETVIDTVYNWGPAQDDWLQRTQARSKSTITGTMLRPRAKIEHPVLENFHSVLLLEYLVPPTDVTFRPFEKFIYFVEAVRMLNRLEINVLFRLHPSSHGYDEYRELCRHFELRCSFDIASPFVKSLTGVDAVIGPGHSGAMLETLMANVAYFPMLIPPHGVPMHYFKDLPVISNFDGLEAALRKPYVWPDAFLQSWTSERDIPDPVQKVMQTMQSTAEQASQNINPATHTEIHCA